MPKQRVHRVQTASGQWVHAAHRFGTDDRPRYQVLCKRVPRRHEFIEVPRTKITCPHCIAKL